MANYDQMQMLAVTSASLSVSMPHKDTLARLPQVVYCILHLSSMGQSSASSRCLAFCCYEQVCRNQTPFQVLPVQGVCERSMPYAGLQSLLSVQSSYQLSQHSTATLALTYQQGAGLGMQVTLPLLCALPLHSCPCIYFLVLLLVHCLPVPRSKSLACLLLHVIRSCSMSTEYFGFCLN